MISIEQALNSILAEVSPVETIDTLPLAEALGRVLATDQHSDLDVPPADNSAMDGYAFKSSSLKQDQDNWLPLHQRVAAGHSPAALPEGSAARIFTGGEIPSGADTVVMQEQCQEKDGLVLVPSTKPVGNNVRPRGQDIQRGDKVLSRGKKLAPQDLGLLASIGKAEVGVSRRLKVAIVSTGDELVNPGEALGPGKIYNSNRFTLTGLLSSMGIDVVETHLVEDTLDATEQALSHAAAHADCVISTGGVSVGDEDHVKPAIEKLGQLALWKIAIKPGKPLAFGDIKGTPFFGLPGNPVSVFITFAILVRPYLQARQGQTVGKLRTLPLQSNFSSTANPKRQEYIRVKIDDDGRVDSYRTQSSGALSSTAWADALAIIPAGTAVNVGDTLAVIPFSELFN